MHNIIIMMQHLYIISTDGRGITEEWGVFLPIKSEFLVIPLPIMSSGTTLNIPLPNSVIVGQLSRVRV